MNKKIILSTVTFIVFILSSYSGAYHPETTHRKITEKAVPESSLGTYLKVHLEVVNGYKEIINGQEIIKWLSDGSSLEDIPMCRATNHFHNPLLPWNQSYMSDDKFLTLAWAVRLYCNLDGWPYSGRKSNVTWATGYLSPPPDGQKDSFNTDPDYAPINWDSAREYYYIALTGRDFTGIEVAPSKEERERYFADTFKSVGHVIHLLQDVSVPAHSRNDFRSHMTFDKINSWNPKDWFFQPFEQYVGNNPTLVTSATPVPSSFTNMRLTDFWDTEQYNENNPEITKDHCSINTGITCNSDSDCSVNEKCVTVGLAEFTNANYFSKGTIPNNDPSTEHTFLYPQVNSTNTEICEDYAPGSTDITKYVSRKDKQGCDHFAAVSLLEEESAITTDNIPNLKLWLDENVLNTYAKELLPRAVGYSAGLLDYFFRGEIDLIPDEITGSGYVIVNNTEEDMDGTFELYYDDTSDDRQLVPGFSYNLSLGSLSSGNNKSSNITFTPPDNVKKYILVFKGTLGNENNAVVGKFIGIQTYFIVIPVDHVTRESLPMEFYSYNSIGSNILTPITESDLPFETLDDGGHWDSATSTWTATSHPDSLGVPLGVGGPQYIAKYKYWDDVSQREGVRFVPNGSYEKEAYQDFHKIYQISGSVIKDFYYVVFEGSPLLEFGAYEENPGYMEYMENPNNLGTYGIYSLRPVVAANPQQRYFSWYNSNNFIGTFLEYDTAKFYKFDKTTDEQAVSQDADAPFPSVVAASRDGNGFKVKIPKIFNYVRPNPYWSGSSGYGSSGIDNYTTDIGFPMSLDSSENKCSSEDNNCGNVYDPGQGSSSVETIYQIPYNYNSYVTIHSNDGGQYYEELYINGQMAESSSIATDWLRTHYQILAVYKDIAVIRETNFVSYTDTPLDYRYTIANIIRIYEEQWNFTAKYYIYVKGVRYDLAGTTNIKSKYLDTVTETMSSPLPPIVDYLTWEAVEDITGYHLDRIFISDSFDGNYILVAFDEYEYNNGAGLVHSLKYEQSDIGDGKYILYYDIPLSEIQGADHEATRVGRKLLLFDANGTLRESLQDPIGLDYTMGTIGILN